MFIKHMLSVRHRPGIPWAAGTGTPWLLSKWVTVSQHQIPICRQTYSSWVPSPGEQSVLHPAVCTGTDSGQALCPPCTRPEPISAGGRPAMFGDILMHESETHPEAPRTCIRVPSFSEDWWASHTARSLNKHSLNDRLSRTIVTSI